MTTIRMIRSCACLVLLFLTSVCLESVECHAIIDSEKERLLASAYALYTLPPFSITFTIPASSSSSSSSSSTTDEFLSDTNGNPILASAFSSPLKVITSEFLLESFRIQMAKADIVESSISDLVRSLQTLDIQVAVHQFSTYGGNDEAESSITTIEEDDRAGDTNGRALKEVQHYKAEFYTTAAFIEPSANSVESKPTNAEVSDLMGSWIELAFMEDKVYYLNSLRRSSNLALQQVTNLNIRTNIEDTNSHANDAIIVQDTPSTSTTTTTDPTNMRGAGTTASGVVPAASSDANWSQPEKILLGVLLLMIVVLIFLSIILACRRRSTVDKLHFRTNAILNEMNTSENSGSNKNHDDEVISALRASDRWLSQNRPDLLDIIQKRGNTTANDNLQQQPTTGPGGERQYANPPSNPFQYLYGASLFKVSLQTTANLPKPPPPLPPQDDYTTNNDASSSSNNYYGVGSNVASAFRLFSRSYSTNRDQEAMAQSNLHSPNSSLSEEGQEPEECTDIEQHEHMMTTGYVPFKSWLQNQFSFLSYREHNPPPSHEDGLVLFGDLACDEDPSAYNFAFRDFPRQDGTPCLIFQEGDDPYFHQHHHGGTGLFSQPLPTQGQLTDEEFQLALVQHGADTSLLNESDDNIAHHRHEYKDEYEHQNDRSKDDSHLTDEEGEDDLHQTNAEFIEKLERLIAMRHRHYEKEAIVERHRQERRREREEKKKKDQQEVERRDLLLRRHTLELDIQELEADWSPNLSMRKLIAEKNLKKNMHHKHRSTSSNPDVLLTDVVEENNNYENENPVTTLTTTTAQNDGGKNYSSLSNLENCFSISNLPPPTHSGNSGIQKIPPRAPLKISPTSIMQDINATNSFSGMTPPSGGAIPIKRSYSFGNFEEKKSSSSSDNAAAAAYSSSTRGSHRRRQSGSGNISVGENVMVHGIYAQFV